ncbi:MAG: hypothetical protein ABI920_12460 [Casimicrobiaceae bacterium]
MRTKPTLERHHGAVIAASAALSALIAIEILTGVTGLLQSRGMPMAQLAVAERACAGKAYVSERESCMRDWVAASGGDKVARR